MPDNLLHAGFARVEITPPEGLPIVGRFRLGGTLQDSMNARGVRRPLYARAVAIRKGSRKVALLSADLCFCADSMVAEVRSRVARGGAIPESGLLVCVTHCHSGPPASEMFGFEGDAARPWLDSLYAKLAGAIDRAEAGMEPVTLRVARGVAEGIASNRRLRLPDGSVGMNFLVSPASGTPLGPVDPEVGYLGFHDGRGTLKGFLFNFACHPQVFLERESLLFGSDISGAALESLESRLDAIGIYTNGAEGDVNVEGNLRERSHAEEGRLGARLAAAVLECAAAASPAEPVVDLLTESLEVRLRPYPSPEKLTAELHAKRAALAALLADGAEREAVWQAQRTLSHSEEIAHAVRQGDTAERRLLELNALRLGPAVLLSVPGELFVELGLEIKRRSPSPYTWILGLCNGYAGYIPTRSSFDEGGYETTVATTSRVTSDTGEHLVGALSDLARRVSS